MTQFESRSVTDGSIALADGTLFYSLVGRGPVVVFAHGLGGNYRSWFQQVDDLSKHFTCLTFSHRGFLPSRDKTGCPRPEFFARDLTALLDHLEIRQVSIVAQSMGGWTAMEFALSAPERVASLVLCGTTGTLKHEKIVSLAETATDLRVRACRAQGIHPAAGERMAREQPALYQKFLTIDQSSGSWDRATVRVALDRMRIRNPAEFEVVRCPVLAIVGIEDFVCPASNVEILASGPMRVDISVVPGSGHSVYFERADVFNAMVLSFLRKLG